MIIFHITKYMWNYVKTFTHKDMWCKMGLDISKHHRRENGIISKRRFLYVHVAM